MRKNLLILLVIITTQLLTSCGSCSNRRSANNEEARQDKTVLVKPYSKEVKGYLSDVLEVVDGEYKLNYSAEMFSKVSIQVKVKSIGVGNPNDYGFKDGNDGPLYIVICDKNGAPIAKIPELASSFENDGLLKDMMKVAAPSGRALLINASNEIQFSSFLPNTAAKRERALSAM